MTMPHWPSDALATAEKMWRDGVAVSKIARAVGKSANAVHNKAHREGWPARENPVKYGGRSHKSEIPIRWDIRQQAIQLPKLASIEMPAPVEIGDQDARISAFGMTAQVADYLSIPTPRPQVCQWPMWGDGKPTHQYCGCEPAAGKPYCEPHCGAVYVRAA